MAGATFMPWVAAEHGYERWQGYTVAQIELAKGKPEACGQHLSDARREPWIDFFRSFHVNITHG